MDRRPARRRLPVPAAESSTHQLFLGGDQIYADDVSMLQLLHATELGQQLIATRNGQPMERITLDKFKKRNPAVATPSQDDPAAAYIDDAPGRTQRCPSTVRTSRRGAGST